jgi:hypothetical protein
MRLRSQRPENNRTAAGGDDRRQRRLVPAGPRRRAARLSLVNFPAQQTPCTGGFRGFSGRDTLTGDSVEQARAIGIRFTSPAANTQARILARCLSGARRSNFKYLYALSIRPTPVLVTINHTIASLGTDEYARILCRRRGMNGIGKRRENASASHATRSTTTMMKRAPLRKVVCLMKPSIIGRAS